jgi:DNA-binding transcriptional LysR family regulator
LKRYCAAQHVLVSMSGDSRGVVDEVLHRQGLSRRVALTVPNFMLALAALQQTDLITALPLSLARTQAARFGLAWAPAPVPLRSSTLRVVTSRAAMQDAGVAWLYEALVAITPGVSDARAKPGSRTRPTRGGNR